VNLDNYLILKGDLQKFSDSVQLINPTPAFTVKTTQTVETVKFGVNYRFGGASGPLTSWY